MKDLIISEMKKQNKAKVRKSPVKKTASKKAKSPKKVAEQPVALTKYKQLRDGSYRIHSWKMRSTPTGQLPDMVTVENSKTDETRRFVNSIRAIAWIEANHTEALVDKGSKIVHKELKTVGLGVLTDTVAAE